MIVGPPRLPLLGNITHIPKTRAHLLFTKWAQQYGGIFSLRIGPAPAVVVTDRSIVRELFDKRSGISSSRPPSYVSQVLITGGDHLLMMNHNRAWQQRRKMIHQQFMASVCEKQHIELLEAEHIQMMRDFLLHPEQHMVHTKRTTNSIIMSLMFGIRTKSWDSSHMVDLYNLMERWTEVMEIGATPPVDILPILKYIPQRVFGNWKDRANEVGRLMETLYKDLRERVVERRQSANEKNTNPCFIDHVLDKQETLGLDDHQVDFLGGVMIEGGSDTGSTALLVLIQAMILHPEIQSKAQQQLDAVCGDSRSPTWADFSQLPYIMMIVKEAMRWRPVAPLGIPHFTTEDTWINGYFLPQNTITFLNVWGLHHDESPDSASFNPDRYEGRTKLSAEYAASSDYTNRDHYSYGVGRRICPGIHLSERSLFLGAAKLLWAFRFEQQVDSMGNPMEIDTDPVTGYTEGFLVCPKPFGCKVIPRSKRHEETILKEFTKAEADVFTQYSTNT
ncbi:unnamed protein product [Penicillium olsonii]|nr:unnamed protein product [Penicillium olsonii]